MQRLLISVLVGALAVIGTPAGAHRQVIQSPENPHAKRVDIESVEVRHPRGLIRFTITFREPHPMDEEELRSSVRIDFRTKRKPPQQFRTVSLQRNLDGSLVGSVHTGAGRTRGFANLFVLDERTVVVELHRQQLRFPVRARVMDWMVSASYDDPGCTTLDVSGVCSDFVPAPTIRERPDGHPIFITRYIRHAFQK